MNSLYIVTFKFELLQIFSICSSCIDEDMLCITLLLQPFLNHMFPDWCYCLDYIYLTSFLHIDYRMHISDIFIIFWFDINMWITYILVYLLYFLSKIWIFVKIFLRFVILSILFISFSLFLLSIFLILHWFFFSNFYGRR